MKSGRLLVILAWLAAAAIGAHAWSSLQPLATEGFYGRNSGGRDALPLYLGGLAASQGLDPTDPSVIIALAREQRDLPRRDQEALSQGGPSASGKESVWSSLYPATTPVMLAPWCTEGWPAFRQRWRSLGYLAVLLGAAGAGAAGVRGKATPVGAALGLVLLSVPAMGLLDNLRLAQANPLLIGLVGLAAFAASRGLAAVAAPLVVLGAALKLGPVLWLGPLLSARRWRALLVSVLLGLALVALTARVVPLPTLLADVWDTASRSNRSLATPGGHSTWTAWLLSLRGRHMALGTVLLPMGLGWLSRRSLEARSEVLAASLPLVLAWMATSARLELSMYHLLLLPGCAFLAAGALPGPGFWRRVWPAPMVLVALGLVEVDPNPYTQGTLAALGVWLALVARMVLAFVPRWRGGRTGSPEQPATG